jgi:hypothetical protein
MASNSIGKWSAQATLDANGFTSGIQKMQNSVRGFVQGPSGLGLLTNLPAALGINSIQGTFSRLNDTLERELNLGFLNDQLGTTVEWLSSLRTVASENSVNADQFASGMERMNQVLGQARLGSSEALETFTRLGLSMEQIESQGFQETFMQAARALSQMPDRAARARTAMELFGRGGAANMLRFVRDLDQSMADVQARGGFTTAEDLARFEEMDNAIDRMATRWETMWKNWLSTIAPAVTTLLEGLTPDANAPEGSTQSMAAAFWGGFGTGLRQMLLTGFAPDVVAGILAPAGAPTAPPGGAQAAAAQGGSAGPSGFGTFLAGLENQIRGVFGAMSDVAREMMEAQREAARIIEQTQTPFERFQADVTRYNELLQMGQLTQDQFNRAVGMGFERLTQGLADAPGVGSLDEGSAEVAEILANAQNPQLNVMQTMLNIQQQELAAMQRNNEIAAQIAGALNVQNQEFVGRDLPRL